MANRKITNRILSKIAERLPNQQYQYLQRYEITQEEARSSGLEVPKELLEGTLMHRNIATASVNHKRRLKQVYKDEGKPGVYKYVLPFLDEDKRHEALKFIHSLPI